MNRKKSTLALMALVVALGCVACGGRQSTATSLDSRAADEAAIRAQAQAWFAAIAARDLDKTLSFYADDAEYLSPNRPAARTAAARRALWVADYAQPGSDSESTDNIEVARSGDLAYQTGKYVATFPDHDGKPVEASGKFVVVWKKQPSGVWKAVIDIDNPN
jgi:ketosteroid isomerase-like protein